ncbi:geranyl transferase [Oleiphilus sp. HI0125]|uniref:polyprenyl synthetase family protein n=2 Tax=Oleiphilus sp. HI0125 TaxID=1822266 RepID=UPI0007C25BC3|nr:farnesyl diphosphate synthase [Oleiphilus sp. HI0125]KZZ59482.1 geranyl transferase [Oleiphilus sp. HI0125]
MEQPIFFSHYRDLIDRALSQFIEDLSGKDTELHKAMHYSVVLGGKRVRPLLTITTAKALNCSEESALHAACAIELIHAYSLIHDDLPAMDDDALRRGQPTCHIAFNEATAILAGDALQALAFELVSSNASPQDNATKLKLIQTLAKASGAEGMVLGQAIDLDSVGKALSLKQLEVMHHHKTGKLISAAVELGALCAEASEKELAALADFSRALGLAFQVQDDILDVTGNTETIGKTSGADEALNKPTYVSLLGLEGAREKLEGLHKDCLSSLNRLNDRDIDELREIADYVIRRIH